jgi:acyl-coenzyme A thioesterase PaaI-like protein
MDREAHLSAVTTSEEMQLVRFAAGVAVYEMPARPVDNGKLVAFAETAMNAAAATAVPDQGTSAQMSTVDICAHFASPVPADADRLTAEAIVVRSEGRRVRVEADVLADGRRIASFEANSGVAL